MAVKSSADIMSALKERLGEDTDDATLEFLGDIQDTFTDLETKTKDTIDWKKKYDELDSSWRKKYRDRFFSGSDNSDDDEDSHEEPKKYSFEDLFK